MGVTQEFWQGGAGPGGDDVERLPSGLFHAGIADGDGKSHPVCGGSQKGAFLGRSLIEGDGKPVPQEFGQYQTWKPCS